MITFLIILLLPMLYITFKVKKMVWHRDKILPLMLTSLTGCVLAFLCYFLFVQISEYDLLWQNNGARSYTCSVIYFAELPAFFLSVGIILNANKWIYFLLRVRAFVVTEKKSALRRANSEFQNLSDSLISSVTGNTTSRTKSSTSSLFTKQTRFTTQIFVLNVLTFGLIFTYLVFFFV